MPQPFLSISTDFGPGNKGIGVMKAVMLGICPEAQIIELANDISGFNIMEGARLFEATFYLPVGQHICVVDPGVGTSRKAIVIETERGDRLIGPNNGVLIPATRFLGGIKRARQITNETFMRLPVSAIFHGRDVFAPAAAHLAAGRSIKEIGPEVKAGELTEAPYEEAKFSGDSIRATVIDINRFGSLFLNVLQPEMHKLAQAGNQLSLICGKKVIPIPYGRTFGDVPVGEAVIMDDDFGRAEVAVNQGSFVKKYGISMGNEITLRKAKK